MQIKHIAMIARDKEQTASFYERVFGFRRVCERDGGEVFPLTTVELTDENVMLTLIQPNAEHEKYSEWVYDAWGLSHFGIQVDNLAETMELLRAEGIEVPDKPIEFNGQQFIKFFDPNGSEIDVADGTWREWDIT